MKDIQTYGQDPTAIRQTDKYKTEYVHSFVEKWDELIDWEARAASEGDFFIRALKERGAKRVLDVATGTGFHSMRLIEAGFDVAGLDAVLEQRTHNRVIVFRPIFPVGGQDLGYLPGSETEKMLPWGAAVADALEAIAGQEVIDEVFDRGLLEVLPLTHIRGRSLTDSFVVIDEAQNLERTVLLTALSRLGQGSRVILTHDVAQRDNLRVGRHDGIARGSH